MPMVSLAHLSMIDAAPEQLVEAAVAGGFDAVSLRLITTLGLPGGVDLVSDAAARRSLKARLSDSGLKVADVESFVLSDAMDPTSFPAVLDVAADLGATHALAMADEEDPMRLVDRFVALCELAATRNITIGVEFVPYRNLKTLGAVRDLLARAAQPNAGVVVDALHLARSGGRPEDLAGLAHSEIAFAQVCDAVAERPPYAGLVTEARTGRLAPGEGALWLDRLLPLLPTTCHISIEAPVAADAHLPFAERGRRLGAAT